MNVRELYDYLDKIIPPSLSCEWDNDGLMVCPDPDREVRRVLVALDVTGEVADEAVDGGFDLIVSHHPLIFEPLKAVTPDDGVAGKVINLIRAGISVMSFHTRLDAVDGGVNDILADMLGFIDAVPFGKEGKMLGRIGKIERPAGLEEFARRVKTVLAAPEVLISGCGRMVNTVAVVGGDGKDDIAYAKAAGADTYVSGRIGYHGMMSAEETCMNLIEAGHFYTEDPVCDRLAELIEEADETIETVYMKSCRIKLIQ
jgi:dinuclear metal center YbgI/SA1388 family protein